MFPSRVVFLREAMQWPPRSPDLVLESFSCEGTLRSKFSYIVLGFSINFGRSFKRFWKKFCHIFIRMIQMCIAHQGFYLDNIFFKSLFKKTFLYLRRKEFLMYITLFFFLIFLWNKGVTSASPYIILKLIPLNKFSGHAAVWNSLFTHSKLPEELFYLYVFFSK